MHIIVTDTRMTMIGFSGSMWNGSSSPFRIEPSFDKYAGMRYYNTLRRALCNDVNKYTLVVNVCVWKQAMIECEK